MKNTLKKSFARLARPARFVGVLTLGWAAISAASSDRAMAYNVPEYTELPLQARVALSLRGAAELSKGFATYDTARIENIPQLARSYVERQPAAN